MNPKNVAIAVLLLGLSMSPASQAESSHSTKGLPGTFVETVNFQGSTFKVLVSFTRDGRSTVLLPFGPPAPGSGDTRVGGLGEWIRTGRREFAGTEFFFASQGYGDTAAVPLQRSIFKLTLDEDGDSFSGPFRYEVIDANGNVLFSGDGTFSGKRLNVVPLD
jgi:hypothetical protein